MLCGTWSLGHSLTLIGVVLSNLIPHHAAGIDSIDTLWNTYEGDTGKADPYLYNEWGEVFSSSFTSIPCSVRNSCSMSERSQITYVDQNCFCDDVCMLYGDCCQDYEPTSTTVTPPLQTSSDDINPGRGVGSCERVASIDHRVEINIVKSCPGQFEEVAVRLRCEQRVYSDVFYDTPVTGVGSKVLYQNLFCAQCAGEVNVSFWHLKIGCGEVPVLNNSSHAGIPSSPVDTHGLLDHVMSADNRDKYFCTVEYYNPLYPARYCKSYLGKCHRDWTNRKIKRRCRSHTSYVYAGKQVFKNQYCAQCNYVNDSYTSCEDTRSPRFNNKELWDTIAPFTILIDPNKGSGTVKYGALNNNYEGTNINTGETHITIMLCSKFEVYDPFSKRCRKVMCFDPESSPICVLTTTEIPTISTTVTNTHVSTTTVRTTIRGVVDSNDEYIYVGLNDDTSNISGPLPSDKDCFLKMLNETDYLEFNNGTIYVQSTRQMLTPIQYQRIGIYIAICSSNALHGNYNSGSGDPLETVLMFNFTDTQKMVSFVGHVISIVCLFILFVLHLLLKPLRTTSGHSVMSLCFALFCAQSVFLLGIHTNQTITICFFMAVSMHYALLVSFFWMNILAIDMLHAATCAAVNGIRRINNGISSNGATLTTTISSPPNTEPTCRFVIYSIYAWCIPTLIVGCSVAMEYNDFAPLYRPYYGRQKLCWMTSRNNVLYFFALPLAVLLAINIILFICILRHMFSRRRSIHSRQISMQNAVGNVPYRPPGVPRGDISYKLRNRGRLTFYIQYCFVVGLTWMFAFVATLIPGHGYLWYAFTGMHVLQAFVLCVACLLNKNTIRILRGDDRVHRSSHNPTSYSCVRDNNSKHLFYHYDEDEEVIGGQETSI